MIQLSRTRLMLGTGIWIATFHYFVIESLAQSAWVTVPYTYRFNTISDLGATLCGKVMNLTYACSPLHPLMNTSFILTGALTILGLILLRPVFPKGIWTTVPLTLIGIGALGTIGVGIFPEDVNPILHITSAVTLFVLANVGMLLLGLNLYRQGWQKRYAAGTIALGSIGLVAFVLLPLTLLTSGIGIVERFVAYPLTFWMIASGMFFLRDKRKRS